MKHPFVLAGFYAAVAIAFVDIDLLNPDLKNLLKARHLEYPFKLFSRQISKQSHQKRGEAGYPPDLQQNLVRGGGKSKKASSHQGNQQRGKATSNQPSQRQGSSGGQRTGKHKHQAADPKADPIPSSPPSPDPPRAEANLQGPGFLHWTRGGDTRQEAVPPGYHHRKVAVHPRFVAAGAVSYADPPANAASRPNDLHPIQTTARGPVAGGAFVVPEGGRAHATADVAGRERQSWDIYGPDERGLSVDPTVPGTVTFHASVTEGGFAQASASDGSAGGSSSRPR